MSFSNVLISYEEASFIVLMFRQEFGLFFQCSNVWLLFAIDAPTCYCYWSLPTLLVVFNILNVSLAVGIWIVKNVFFAIRIWRLWFRNCSMFVETLCRITCKKGSKRATIRTWSTKNVLLTLQFYVTLLNSEKFPIDCVKFPINSERVITSFSFW